MCYTCSRLLNHLSESDMDKKVTIELSEPLTTLSGETISTLTADFGKVTVRDIPMVNRLERRLKGASDEIDLGSLSKAASVEWRSAMTWVAILKGTKNVCMDDIDRLSIPDYMELGSASVPFIVRALV